MSEPIPERIGSYRVIRLVGEGGMGQVFEAVQEQIERMSQTALMDSLLVYPLGSPIRGMTFHLPKRAIASKVWILDGFLAFTS